MLMEMQMKRAILTVLLVASSVFCGCSSEPETGWFYVNRSLAEDDAEIVVTCGSVVEIGVLNRESVAQSATMQVTTMTFDADFPADAVQLAAYPSPFGDQVVGFLTAPSGDACPNSTGVRATLGGESRNVTIRAVP